MVEFVLVALELFVVVFACLEFGRMLLVYTNVANAARVGLRYAIVRGFDRNGGAGEDGMAGQTEICNKVKEYTKGGLLDTSKLLCTVTGAGQLPGFPVQVTVVYPYDPFFTAFPKLNVRLGTTAQGIITY